MRPHFGVSVLVAGCATASVPTDPHEPEAPIEGHGSEAEARAPAPAPAEPLPWCVVIVEGTTASEGCYASAAECDEARAGFRAAGKATTDCAGKAPAVLVTPLAPTVPKQWCTTVDLEGATGTESCHPSADECEAARDSRANAGTKASPCVESVSPAPAP